MSLRVAFVGFRHDHILSLHKLIQEHSKAVIVAACEEDADAGVKAAARGVTITHTNYAEMLAEVDCDIIACGDYYGIRGERLIQAMEAGRHVIGDKPLCTRIEELDRIEGLARDRKLCVSCMLELPDRGPFITLRDVIHGGRIGEVHTLTFLGQHPLNYGQRSPWYFEPGKHGGTLNDIAIHAVDLIPWLTGRTIVEVTAARAWNARLTQHPHFQDGAMVMLRLDNDGGVMGDVSYLSADRHGYNVPAYWRFSVAGSEGFAETGCNETCVRLWHPDADTVQEEPAAPPRKGGYFEDFLDDLAGTPSAHGLNTNRVLASSRTTLLAQAAADEQRFPRLL